MEKELQTNIAPGISATLIQAGEPDDGGPTLTFAVSREDLQRWIKERGGLCLYREGKLTFLTSYQPPNGPPPSPPAEPETEQDNGKLETANKRKING